MFYHGLPDAYQLLQLYQKAVPSSFFEEICREQDGKVERGYRFSKRRLPRHRHGRKWGFDAMMTLPISAHIIPPVKDRAQPGARALKRPFANGPVHVFRFGGAFAVRLAPIQAGPVLVRKLWAPSLGAPPPGNSLASATRWKRKHQPW